MANPDWERVQQLFHDVLAAPAEDRERSLGVATGGDLKLMDEVRSLVEAFESGDDVLDGSVLELGIAALNGDLRDSLAGQEIGPFRILRELGRGGMGDVYLAENQRLNNLVALKFLSDELVNDVRAARNLKREAQTAALLDHPNICRIHQFEEIGDHSFIVMEYVKGEPLSRLLKNGTLPKQQTMPVAKQITAAIAAAHESGMIHRDIKPGNVMVTSSAEVRVLDFGLARFVHDMNRPRSGTEYATNATTKGLILGTIAYMSPEQHRGEKLELTTDVFSLGTLLYEIFSGAHPFEKKSDAETVSSILGAVPDFEKGNASRLAPRLKRILRRCLQADAALRYPNAVDLLADLEKVDRVDVAPWRSIVQRATMGLLVIGLLLSILYFLVGTSDVNGVAILPFANETGDTSLDYLADGLPERMGAKLSAIEGFRVVPYTRLSGLAGRLPDPGSVGREVHADVVLVGRIYRIDTEVAIETRLIDTRDAGVLREHSQTFPTDRIGEVEDQLIERMFAGFELRPILSNANPKRVGKETQSPEALESYLRGRYFWRKRDPQNLELAMAAFNRAIEFDPNYSKPWSGLADTYILMNSVAYGKIPPKESFAKARAAAKLAIELDPLNAEAYTSLGVVLTKHDWNWNEAERMYRKAIELDPDHAAGHYWLSGLLGITGRSAESIAAAEKARELDPFSPLVEYNLARTYYFARQHERSLAILEGLDGPAAGESKILYLKGLNLLQTRAYPEALKLFTEVTEKNRMLGIAAKGFALAKVGERGEAAKIAASLEAEATRSYVPPQEIAIIYVGLGEKDKAFEYLAKALEERYGSFSAIKVEPLFDPIRGDIRFAELLRRIALDGA